MNEPWREATQREKEFVEVRGRHLGRVIAGGMLEHMAKVAYCGS